jgi:hypothetical protein
VSGILDAIGNTPLVRLSRCAPRNGAELWLKLEYRNLTTRCSNDGPCSANINCTNASVEGGCFGGPAKGNPPEDDFLSLGFDTLDLQDAINFTFPLGVPLGL